MQIRGLARAALEVVAGVAVAVGLVAALQPVAPITGLSVVPLLAVLALAVLRGELAGLAAAVLSVLALNFFFLDPRYQLRIADRGNAITLVVFLIAALVVGRLAGLARERARVAEERARAAAAREREAAMLARVARRLLRGGSLGGQLAWIGERVAEALDARSARVELASAPGSTPGGRTVRLPLQARSGWLHVEGGEEPERVVEPLARLLDLALERERVGAQAAEAEAARRGDVAKTAVLHAISHDLRSPLTAIATAAAALQDEGTDGADRRELVAVVGEESRRLARLVDDLLDLSKIEAGVVAPREDWCDLREAVTRAVEQARAVPGAAPIALELPEDLPLVRADPTQLERVFGNLLENAVKFSPPDVPVVVRGGVGDRLVTVRVIDRGPGIPKAQRPRIFEPFFRGRPARGGAGLGLAISRGFVEANGGRIVLQAGPDGETAFAVSLPLAPRPAVAP